MHIPEVRDARVVIVLAWKEGAREVCRVCIGKRVILGIPTTKTNVKATNTRAMIVDNDNFLVVGPKLDIIYQINALARLKKNTRTFRPNMVRVAHARNVRVESLESFLRCRMCYASRGLKIDGRMPYLGVRRAHTHCLSNLVEVCELTGYYRWQQTVTSL